MPDSSSSRRQATLRRRARQSGVSLLVAIMSLVLVVPMMGMMIDVAVLYTVRARIQAAVDGASLAAARALNLGQTTADQATAAKQNAVNWFYANFPDGNWSTFSTNMSQSTVNVWDDPGNPQLRNVTVTATTMAPTYFMRWFGFNGVQVGANGNASRRDVVAMLVLDRSGSMCGASQPCGSANTSTPCAAMIKAAKTFTGQFAAGRDRIGLVTFSDGTYMASAPVTNFQTKLGYSNTSGSGSGLIDSISCNGGTGTAAAISIAYNELYKMALPGALNLIVFETDGKPNTLAYNWWNSNTAGIRTGSGCKDKNNNTLAQGGWTTANSMPYWTAGYNMNDTGTGYMGNIPPGPIGSYYSADTYNSSYPLYVLYNPWQNGHSAGNNSGTAGGSGCTWAGGLSPDDKDLQWLPGTDIYGNSVNPVNAYQTVNMSNGRVVLLGGSGNTYTDWTNTRAAAINGADNSAYRARTNSTLPAYMFVVGLGGNGSVDMVLLQRMANDPSGDTFNATPAYDPCPTEPGCITYANQPQGTFVYSPTTAQLTQAFLKISSQVLRLSR